MNSVKVHRALSLYFYTKLTDCNIQEFDMDLKHMKMTDSNVLEWSIVNFTLWFIIQPIQNIKEHFRI
jgi:hypothetical protein